MMVRHGQEQHYDHIIQLSKHIKTRIITNYDCTIHKRVEDIDNYSAIYSFCV